MAKLTLEFNERANEMLQELAARDDTTKVTVIRRALALYKYVDEEVRKNKKRRVAIIEEDKILETIVMP